MSNKKARAQARKASVAARSATAQSKHAEQDEDDFAPAAEETAGPEAYAVGVDSVDEPFDVEHFDRTREVSGRHLVMNDLADRQRAHVRQAILNEADRLMDEGYRQGMSMMGHTSPRAIVDALVPVVQEANRIRSTARRFAPIDRAS